MKGTSYIPDAGVLGNRAKKAEIEPDRLSETPPLELELAEPVLAPIRRPHAEDFEVRFSGTGPQYVVMSESP
jgi:hypothetical protein